MSVVAVKQFFNNKVTITLKSGHKFQGLLSSINHKNLQLTLEDVEDLGNDQDKNVLVHDKKIAEKVFEYENINEIFMKEKHFSEPKKYKQEEFWDAISQPQNNQKKYRPKEENQRSNNNNRGGYNNYGRGGYRNNDNRDREERPYNNNRDKRQYQEKKPYKKEQSDERDYR